MVATHQSKRLSVTPFATIRSRAQTFSDLYCGAITSELIDEIRSEVRRLVASADFDSADRLSDCCLLLAADVGDPLTRARAVRTKAATILRTNPNQTVRALQYYDDAIRLYDDSGDELSSAVIRLDRIVLQASRPL